MMPKFFSRLLSKDDATQSQILSTSAFKELLRKERARADRRRGHFALVAIDIDSSKPQGDDLGLIGKTIRLTDEIGWYDRTRVGVFLPDTDRRGAEAFIGKLEKAFAESTVRCDVMLYDEREHASHGTDAGGSSKDVEMFPATTDSESSAKELALDGSTASLSRYLSYPTSFAKRALDIVGASSLLIGLSPFIIGAALATKLSSSGPILFRQKRVGRGGQLFTMYKFRSMIVGADEMKEKLRAQNEKSGPIFKMENDPRVTKVGRLLRRTSIDELPQLWNVLVGHMSLVGPRPPTPDEVGKYAGWHRRRLDLVGGLTCFWQVGGRSEIDFEDWMRLDNQYIRRQSIKTDLTLLLQTPVAVLTGRGAK